MARVVFHSGEQLGKHHGRIRSPVPVVTAVKPADGSERGDLEMRVATRTEYHGLAPALIDGPVTDEPDISVNEIAMLAKDGLQMRRAGFFFAFPDKTNIRLERNLCCAQGVEGGEL